VIVLAACIVALGLVAAAGLVAHKPADRAITIRDDQIRELIRALMAKNLREFDAPQIAETAAASAVPLDETKVAREVLTLINSADPNVMT
jgi:predicted secreted protein